jgi:hypothetical protein
MSHFHVNPGDKITIDHSIVVHIGNGWVRIIGPKDTHCLHTPKKSCARETRDTDSKNKNKLKS